MRTILLASVCMFVALSLVGCDQPQSDEQELPQANVTTRAVIDSFMGSIYIACVDGLEFMILTGSKKGAMLQIMDTDGLPKTCDQGAL